ncbi:hypothetical protein WU75_10745 [Vibrio parahaemolyticus]|nr:hypothetical protein [Vibrio parahaemolyticus]KKI09358.1 hypothetical protein WU75_10745 [Vibrio parahaemolyticus]KYZ04792.1 hypothetical protein AW033_02775 [Vibrio parahaemolyticus]
MLESSFLDFISFIKIQKSKNPKIQKSKNPKIQKSKNPKILKVKRGASAPLLMRMCEHSDYG